MQVIDQALSSSQFKDHLAGASDLSTKENDLLKIIIEEIAIKVLSKTLVLLSFKVQKKLMVY